MRAVEPLVAGDKLSREEFLHRWEAMPNVKRAELIGGVVYMPSPVGPLHSEMQSRVSGIFQLYVTSTPGCITGISATFNMMEDSAQPDVYLRFSPESGGTAVIERGLLSGAPELAAEICHSTSAYDLHQKMDLY